MKITHFVSFSVLSVALLSPISAGAAGAAWQPPGARAAALTTYADLHGVTVQTGSGSNTALASNTYDPVDQIKTVNCKPKKGCLILIQAMVQALSSGGGDPWAICAKVDDSFANPACPFQGMLPKTSQIGSVSQSMVVPAGKHSVQTFVYFQGVTGVLGNWQTSYTLLQN